jgi:D-alanyl-D-alanine carboxypeptidase (penicillin-binding protein 5/6)
MRLISVVLGTKSPAARANESQALLNYGFRFFETHLLWEQGEIVTDARVWKGNRESTELVVNQPVYITIPRGAREQVETSVVIPDQIIAPLETDVSVGRVRAVLAAETLAEQDIYSATPVPEGSLLQTTWDELLLWFE